MKKIIQSCKCEITQLMIKKGWIYLGDKYDLIFYRYLHFGTSVIKGCPDCGDILTIQDDEKPKTEKWKNLPEDYIYWIRNKNGSGEAILAKAMNLLAHKVFSES